MSEQPTENLDELVKVARDLREIETLSDDLADQALHKATDPLMPGGDAMVMLAHVASLEAWEHRAETLERIWAEDPFATDADRPDFSHEDDAWEPALQTLAFWSEQWREAHGRVSDRRPTIASEAGFLRQVLHWAYDHEPRWDDFAKDIRTARLRIENVLRAGMRSERSRVPCSNTTCPTKPKLVKVYRDHIEHDHYKCPGCKHRYTHDDYQRAYARYLRSEGADRFVRITDAVGMLRAVGRPERTIRKWFAECMVHAYCDTTTRQAWVWWPDLWHLHLATPRRRSSVVLVGE